MLGECVFAPTSIIWQQEDVRASWRFDRLRGKRRMKAQSCVCYLGCDVNKDEIIVLFKSQLFGVVLALTVSTACVSLQLLKLF